MSKQLTLFGTSAKDNKRAGNLIYKDPKSKYEKFIERFVRRNKGQASRESVVRSAQEKWKELRKDSAAVETYIAAKEGEEEILSLEESQLKSSHDENPERLHIGTWFKKVEKSSVENWSCFLFNYVTSAVPHMTYNL